MLELTPDNTAVYLRAAGHLAADEPAHVEPLGGGVSNAVLRVTTPSRVFVLKQSRPQLRTRDLWLGDIARVYREQEVMEFLAPLLPIGSVPAVLFADRPNYVFAMSHAPADAVVWKERLLVGDVDLALGERAGALLGRIHEATAQRRADLSSFADATVFVQLRVDPFYRRIQERLPDVAGLVEPLVEQLRSVKEAICHGDFSPKNLLAHSGQFTLVDYETAHLGDPTMDLGFFLSHVLLKAMKRSDERVKYAELTRAFWRGYEGEVRFRPVAELRARGIGHLAVCLLARIDGTSPVDYLPEEPKRAAVRRLGRELLAGRPTMWEDVLVLLARSAPASGVALAPRDSRRLRDRARRARRAGRTRIERLRAREVLDSRGNPTVEVDVFQGGVRGRAIVPSGASTGRHEAVELRDGDPTRYDGKGVRRAVAHVNDILAPLLVGRDAVDQAAIDRLLCAADGTPNKDRLGANALLGVSLACAQAAAAVKGVPLWRHLFDLAGTAPAPLMPLPMVNLLSGGLHAGRNLDFQDFLLIPLGARSYSEALETIVAVYRSLARVLMARGAEGVLVGDEGGFGPRLRDNEEAVQLCVEAIRAVGRDAALALDVASTHFFDGERYRLRGADLTRDEMAALLTSWVEKYPIVSIEDGMAEDDWDGWRTLTAALGRRVQLVGDDLFVTNPERLQRGIAEGVANAVLVKVNQIGTLTETLDVIRRAKAAGYRTVVSARSGETEDSFLADLAVATGAGQIKIGSVARSERLAKYNQLLRIEEELGEAAAFARW